MFDGGTFLHILSELLSGFVLIVILIIIILVLITLEDPEWWTHLKGMSIKKKVLYVFLVVIIWIIIELLLRKIE